MSQEKQPGVNWVRKTQLSNGVELSISEKSGIVKVKPPGCQDRRAPNLYRDEIIMLMAVATELQQYLETNQDLALSKEAKDAARDTSKLKQRTGNFHGAKADLIKTMVANGKTPDEIKQILEISGFAEKVG